MTELPGQRQHAREAEQHDREVLRRAELQRERREAAAKEDQRQPAHEPPDERRERRPAERLRARGPGGSSCAVPE